jgi:hypothetical protein
MSLSEKFKTRTLTSQGHTNSIDRWLATLEPTEREAAASMLRDATWSQREVRWAFRDEGFHVSAATIGEWRMLNGVTS